jgi:hypothetical protein
MQIDITTIKLMRCFNVTKEFNYLDIIIKHSVSISITLQQLKGPLALKIFKLHKPKLLLSLFFQRERERERERKEKKISVYHAMQLLAC